MTLIHNLIGFFHIFLHYVSQEELQDYSSIFIMYHQCNIYYYRLESVILMKLFLALFQFHFPYHIRTDNIVTVLNVLESVI